jgi:hypothetical protein
MITCVIKKMGKQEVHAGIWVRVPVKNWVIFSHKILGTRSTEVVPTNI